MWNITDTMAYIFSFIFEGYKPICVYVRRWWLIIATYTLTSLIDSFKRKTITYKSLWIIYSCNDCGKFIFAILIHWIGFFCSRTFFHELMWSVKNYNQELVNFGLCNIMPVHALFSRSLASACMHGAIKWQMTFPFCI